VREDADRGRLYLLRKYLDAAQVPHDPLAAPGTPGLPKVCARGAALAHARLHAAREAMAGCDQQPMRPVWLMGATYAARLGAVG